MADITFADISHAYAPRPSEGDYVLRHVDRRFADGGAYALLGPSGCGKTTMLNIISGLIQPTAGKVLYGDKNVTPLPTRERNIAQVFQFPVIYDTMTVFDNLAFPLRNRGRKGSEVKKRVTEIAAMLELDSWLSKRAANLTPDLKQIISLGRGLVRDDVAAILLDEPLTVIDPQRKWTLRRMLRQVHEELHHTSIYVTHDQTEALTFADRVLVMHEGDILQEGSPQQLFERPAHTFVGYFIGTPGMNVLPCQIAGSTAVVAEYRAPLDEAVGRAAAGKSGSFELGIRPEHIEIVDSADSDNPHRIPVTVTTVEDHGYFRIVLATLGEHSIRIKTQSDRPLAPGQSADIVFSPDYQHLYCDGRIVDPEGSEAPAGQPDDPGGPAGGEQ